MVSGSGPGWVMSWIGSSWADRLDAVAAWTPARLKCTAVPARAGQIRQRWPSRNWNQCWSRSRSRTGSISGRATQPVTEVDRMPGGGCGLERTDVGRAQ